MSSHIDLVRGGYERFNATRELQTDILAPDFVWDMSHFHGWPEDQIYEGAEAAREFLTAWRDAWDDWELKLESLQEAGDRVLAIMQQRGRAKTSGMSVDMRFAQIWTIRDGKETRMDMYSDVDEAIRALNSTR
jgi:ketosteroid isomerase-like protein